MPGVAGNGDIGDGGILRFARTVRDHHAVTGALGHFHRLQGLRERADLVRLDEDGVAHAFADTAGEQIGVRNKNVIADQLHPRA